MGRKRGTTRLAAGEAESGRKAGRLCCSQNDGFPQGLAQEIQEAPQERAKKAQVEAIGFAAMLGVDVGTVARAIGGSKSDQGESGLPSRAPIGSPCWASLPIGGSAHARRVESS